MFNPISLITWQLLLFILIVLLWTLIVVYLDKKGILKRYGMDRIWILALMWRTEKGRGLIDRIASKKKAWMRISTGGFIFFFTGMLFMFILLAISAFISVTSPLVKPVKASEVLVLPGINPYVPFIYGIIGLVVAVVAHELSHGIIARVMGFKVKALGLLFILIPIGAFMEPDEEEVEKAPRLSRMRMFSAGPVMNFILAFLFLGLFSFGMMGSLHADGEPLIITEVSSSSPAHLSLDAHPKALYNLNGTRITSNMDLYEYNRTDPGGYVFAEFKMNGGRYLVPMVAGVMIIGIVEDTPAEVSGLQEGDILTSVDGHPIKSGMDFHNIMESTEAGQNINITVLSPLRNERGEILLKMRLSEDLLEQGNASLWEGFDEDTVPLYEGTMEFPEYVRISHNITLDDKGDHYYSSNFKGKGYLGVSTSYLGISGVGSSPFLEVLHHPFSSGNTLLERFQNMISITFYLPLQTDRMPFHDPLTDIYDVHGPLSILPESIFWFLANTIFYIFWLNILLGLFNALPMIPLDGGFVFRDAMVYILKWILGIPGKLLKRELTSGPFRKRSDEELSRLARTISIAASFLVLSLIIASLMGPRLQLLFR